MTTEDNPDNRAALVTGASRGIGRAVALRLAASGMAVAINYRAQKDEAVALVRQITRAGGRAVSIKADVAVPEEAAGLVPQAEDELGPLAVVVNNAGITRDRLVLQMSEADWDLIWQTNFVGTRSVARAALRSMIPRRHGRLINVSSVVGLTGNAGQANYAAAKAAVLGLTKQLAAEAASAEVAVNAVVPGYIITDATADLTEEQHAEWLRRIPMHHPATVEEVANVICYFATEANSYLTGQCVAVDGGLVAASGLSMLP